MKSVYCKAFNGELYRSLAETETGEIKAIWINLSDLETTITIDHDISRFETDNKVPFDERYRRFVQMYPTAVEVPEAEFKQVLQKANEIIQKSI